MRSERQSRKSKWEEKSRGQGIYNIPKVTKNMEVIQRQYNFLDNEKEDLAHKIREKTCELTRLQNSFQFFDEWGKQYSENSTDPLYIEQKFYLANMINEYKIRINELKTTIETLQKELNIITRWYNMFEPCDACSGHGKFRIWEAQDESHLEDCKKCKGKGFNVKSIETGHGFTLQL